MTHLMTHQKIIDGITCLLPHRKGQYTGVDIKASSLAFFMLNHKILSGKQFSKLRLDFVRDSHRFVSDESIIRRRVAF
jgi:hypothetical protein